MNITISDHKIDLLEELLVVKDFICIVGSSVKSDGADVDVLIRAKEASDSFLVQNENIILPIRKILDPEKEGYLHWIKNPQGFHSDAIPLYDLILRKKEHIQIEFVKDLVKLDLGCGDSKAKGFIGIDSVQYPGVDMIYDLNRNIPFPNDSVSEIRAIHFLEHVYSPDLIMREIHRVLVDGGVFNFIVPSIRGEGAFAHPDHKCLSPDTEVLTFDGFRLISDCKVGDTILSLNPDSKETEWTQVTDVVNEPYNGNMYHFLGQGVDIDVTPNHKLFAGMVSRVKGKEYDSRRLRSAEAVLHSSTSIKGMATIPWNPEDNISEFELPIPNFDAPIHAPWKQLKFDLTPFCRFLGWWLSEGHVSIVKNWSYVISISQSESSFKTLDIEETIKSLGFKPHWTGIRCEFACRELALYLQKLGHSKDKYIPSFFKNLPKKYLEQILDGLTAGGGHRRSSGWEYDSVSKRLVDDVQEIALKCGYRASVHEDRKIVKADTLCEGDGQSIGGKWVLYRVSIDESSNIPRYPTPRIHTYNGNVVCLRLKDNHIMLIRKCGKVIWTGNSWWCKSSFAFWSAPELLGSRPQFKIVELQEIKYSEEKVDVVGTLAAVKRMSKETSLRPISKFIPPKPVAASYTDAFSGDDLWDKWASKMQFPMYVEPKYNSFRGIIQKSDSNVSVVFEDTLGDNKALKLGLIQELKKIDDDFIVDCAIGIKKDDHWLSRIQLMTLTSDKPILESGEKIISVCFDILYLNGDIHVKPFSERRKILEGFYEKSLKSTGMFEISPSFECNDKKSLMKFITRVSQMDGSEGSVVKTADGTYSLSGVTNGWGKTKNVLELKVQVHDVQENKNGTYSYSIGILKGDTSYINVCDDSSILNLGKTFSTRIKASKGDIVTIELEELLPQKDELHMLGARVIDVDKSRSTPYTATQVIDMASRSSVLQKSSFEEGETRADTASSFWKSSWYQVYPKSGRGKFVYQHHWRGLTEEDTKLSEDELLLTNHSVHGDLRLETDDKWLWGFSVFLGKVSELRGDGRDLFRLKNQDKLQGAPKLRQPYDWLTIAHKHPYISPPSGAGSTRISWSKFFEIDSGEYEVGVWREHFVEIFLHGDNFKGRMLIQYAPIEGQRVWLLSMPDSQIPYADTHDKEGIIKELKSKDQKYLMWAKPGEKPELINISSKSLSMRFFKEDAAKQIVYGVVFEPSMIDLQDESVNEDDIEESAHNYLVGYRNTMLSHKDKLDADVVESYIAVDDFVYNSEPIKKGSWIVAMRIKDPKIWNRVISGEIVGFSPGGTKTFV